MKSYILSEASEHEMKLVQMGAKVEQISSKMCYVKFNVNDVEVEYVYNINTKNQYFLERIKPYPLALKTLDTEDRVVKLIGIDLEQFKNAVTSSNINCFIEVGNDLNNAMKKFEDLFLYYNVSKEECELIHQKVEAVIEEVYHAKSTSERVYFAKEPEYL